MTCPSCDAAQAQPRAAQFTPGCDSCMARALAVTGAHSESQQAGHLTEQYRTALEKCFGEAWQRGHESVKEWAKRMKGRHA